MPKIVLVGSEKDLEGLTLVEKLKGMDRLASKRPDVLEGKTYQRKADGKKWYITVNKDPNGNLCEIFSHTNSRELGVVILDAVEKLTKLALYHNVNELFIQEQGLKGKHQSNADKMCRMISLCLRHGVPLLDIVNTLDLLDHNITNLTWHICKVLAMALDEAPKGKKMALNVCPQCKKDTLIYEGGCKKCLECGYSRCG
jgi:hypothetical protein